MTARALRIKGKFGEKESHHSFTSFSLKMAATMYSEALE
jgi:hypothetical protein